jgi:hypothetical protein
MEQPESGYTITNESFESLVALWWDDLDPRQGGNIYYFYDNVFDRFIVSFENIRFYSGLSGTGSLSFQVFLKSNGSINFQYGTMDPGTLTLESATIGIQNSEADDALEVAHNAAYMHNDLVVSIWADHWLSVWPASGSIAPYSWVTVEVLLSAHDLESGLYTGQVLIFSNDPDLPVWPYSVRMTVGYPNCGDVDGSGSGPDIADLVYLVDYMFTGGPPPPNLDAANIDGIGDIDIADLVHLVDYMFNGGAAPVCP